MEVQTECSEPPLCDPQPSGKINKAAFKLFGKRKSGGGMPSIFSVRNKGEGGGKSAGKMVDLVRSKTHDGLMAETTKASELEGHKKEESASSDQLHSAALETGSVPQTRSSISKSLSFFTLLRRSSTRAVEGSATLGRRGRGLKGLFSSMRWRRKEKAGQEDIGEVQQEVKEGDLMLGSRSSSVEIKDDVTLILEPQLHPTEDISGSSAATSDCGSGDAPTQDPQQETLPSLQQACSQESSQASKLRAPHTGSPTVKHCSPARLTASSAPDSIVTPPLDRSAADPPSEPSVDRLCSMFTDVTSLKSFDSLTGCGDIIADVEEDAGNGNGISVTSSGTGSSNGGGGGGVRRVSGVGGVTERCSPAKPPLATQVTCIGAPPAAAYIPLHQRVRPTPPKPQQGSGVVAYMGGGEEMASPEGVDDADMQGLWHMLPQKGEDSPALPRADPVLHHAHPRVEKRTPPVKGLGLSKIPVSGSSRAGKPHSAHPSPPPFDKDPQDAPPSDEGYWDSPTPGPEDEESGFLRRDGGLTRDSCSGDALYDLYDPDSPGAIASDDEDMSSPSPPSGNVKHSPPSQAQSSSSSSSFRSMKGSTSLPRDSKIPVSVRHVPPTHSSSQGALSSGVSPTSSKPPATVDGPPRTRIPVSKVPVRRSGNKAASAARSRK
ncbi:APC membrane recruitment protein 2 [Denticeps clupeoides]|uniref:APC membrane recruitment protein 2 n=1 Tax=Denticeps clupeoides TaxID=299321 RepID=A0AAY4DUQ9_9TELE|nr:APC membrane recruitment protein 2 [Denticeps clupeoides]